MARAQVALEALVERQALAVLPRLVALLLAVVPANLNVAVYNLQIAGYPAAPLYHWGRVLRQVVLIGLVWWASQPPATRASRLPALTTRSGGLLRLRPRAASTGKER